MILMFLLNHYHGHNYCIIVLIMLHFYSLSPFNLNIMADKTTVLTSEQYK